MDLHFQLEDANILYDHKIDHVSVPGTSEGHPVSDQNSKLCQIGQISMFGKSRIGKTGSYP